MAIVSAMPSPYSLCPLPADSTMWWPYSWWMMLRNAVLARSVVRGQKLSVGGLTSPSYQAPPVRSQVWVSVTLTLTRKLVSPAITGYSGTDASSRSRRSFTPLYTLSCASTFSGGTECLGARSWPDRAA